jgi:uncharacterized lipoprotein
MRLVACVTALLLLGACAFTEETVPVDYKAPANMELAAGASDVSVSVESKDGRVSNKDRVSSKKNGYGIETAPIKAQNDVVALTQQAVEHELESLGFKVGPGGLKAVVELQTFYNDFKNGFFSGDAVAEVGFNLTVTRSDGSFVYSRGYKGIGMNKNIQLASGSNARLALEEALTNAMQQFVEDTNMHKALVAAVKGPMQISTKAASPSS